MKVRLWGLSSSWSSVKLKGHQVSSLLRTTDSPDGHSILTASGRSVQQWDSKTGASLPIPFQFPEAVLVTAVEFSPDGDQIAAVVGEGNVQVWDRRTCAVGPVFKAEPWRLLNAVYSPCGRLVAAFSRIYCFWLWDLHNTTVKEHHVFVTLEGNGCFERRSVTFSLPDTSLRLALTMAPITFLILNQATVCLPWSWRNKPSGRWHIHRTTRN